MSQVVRKWVTFGGNRESVEEMLLALDVTASNCYSFIMQVILLEYLSREGFLAEHAGSFFFVFFVFFKQIPSSNSQLGESPDNHCLFVFDVGCWSGTFVIRPCGEGFFQAATTPICVVVA